MSSHFIIENMQSDAKCLQMIMRAYRSAPFAAEVKPETESTLSLNYKTAERKKGKERKRQAKK